MLDEEQIRRYSRHILLREVGGGGQRRLLDAAVRLPSLDAPRRSLALWLARAGIGRLLLPADDSAAPASDPSGLLHASDEGKPLAQAVKARLLEHQPGLAFDESADALDAGELGGPEGALALLRRLLFPDSVS